MYVEQLDIEIRAGSLEPALLERALVSLGALEGGVSFRLYRDVEQSGRLVLLSTWSTQESSRAAERLVGAELLASIGAHSLQRESFELLDMAWGREADRFQARGIWADHITAWVAPGKWEQWRPYARNFVSVMVRQPGIIAEEMLRSGSEPLRFIALRSFVSRAAARVGPEFEPPEEVRLATEPGQARGVYEGAAPPRYRMLELCAAAWGKAGRAAYDAYVQALDPV